MQSIVHGFLIQTSGEEKNYSERVMLIYDGLHYDALAMSPFEGASEEFDQTIFAVQNDRTIGPVEGLALDLVKDQQWNRSYTDTANFSLRCGVCQIGVVGQKEAVEQHKQQAM
ncbi:OVARIAN TUMOR DOMAIN-containing deubiquitinating enzyme 2-like isoform X2 [Hibiscus syriacus]|uniref:OVARIAN TUMOR DOMAIN-containing deubiquitinating enzyme 2-like isoform X2 n=1 Tax=Hibiscus syriacus TaxID=106335 RepID=UPI0019247B70|nr:OVARIAN TUMOR DOMAIN-containing deubiquitinating enzyme 2-like isoform X2 [Hibiscus syriacus]